MNISEWEWRSIIFLSFLTTQFICTNGRRYDKCETPDGRLGVCVVKRYCRERTVQALLQCDDDGNFCCPIQTNELSTSSSAPLPSQPLYNANVPKPTRATPFDSDPKELYNNRQNPSRTFDIPEKDSSLRTPDVYEYTHKQYDEQDNRKDTGYYEPEIQSKPQVPNVRDFPASNNKPDGFDYSNTQYDEPAVYKTETQSRPRVPPGVINPEFHSGRQRDYDRRPEPGFSRTTKFYHLQTETFEITTKRPPRVLFPALDDSMQNPLLPVKPMDKARRPTIPHQFGNDRNNDKRTNYTTEQKDIDVNRPVQPPVPSIGLYPSRDQFEVQRLPSNPRRIKPLRFDNSNETDFHTDHRFFSKESSLPKVPSCGVKPYDLFIAGGETSQPYEWPWMTAIFRRHQGSRPKTFLCGGSLINTKYVLTAAHCFVNNYVILPASSFVLRLGSHFLDNGEEYTVEDLVIHHNHSGQDFFNDIALVRIASEVYVTDKIAPICLPSPDMMTQNLVERLATVAGWGDTTFRTGASRALQHVAIPIVSSDECFAAYSRVRGAAFLARGSDHVICAGLREGGKDACLGDSGGPLMLKTIDDRWTIVGIVSLGYKCAEPGYPGVYTRVTHYLSWIQANMKMP